VLLVLPGNGDQRGFEIKGDWSQRDGPRRRGRRVHLGHLLVRLDLLLGLFLFLLWLPLFFLVRPRPPRDPET
jgi:hypothetical protein